MRPDYPVFTGIVTKGLTMPDFHKETLDNDVAFHQFMDRAFPDWRTWDFKKQRQAAKRWNFTRLYSIGQEGLDKLKGEIDG